MVFVLAGVVLTEASLLFPQSLGKFQKVAGWPITMYMVEYRYVGDIDSSGRITRILVPDETKLLASRMFVNIVLWTLILYGTWWFNERGRFLRTRSSSE